LQLPREHAGHDGGRIHLGPPDRRSFLVLFANVVLAHGWECLAYCLMTTHYHAVIRLTKPNLAAGMAMLNGVWAKRFNKRHSREGHLFERRYHSGFLETEGHLFQALRYVELNPVTAGHCAHPNHWNWSSYRAIAGEEPEPAFLAVAEVLALFGESPETARRRYVGFVAEGLP
jgi:REP element-mobilizing transposase RayT